jgi:hypothetical protein
VLLYLNIIFGYRLKDIRAGINAFTLMEKELKESNIPIKENIIIKAFRVI